MRAIATVLSLVMLCSVAGGQQKGKGVAQVTEATAAEYAYLQKLPETTGKLGSLNASSKQFSLLVEYQTGPAQTSGATAQLQRIMREIAQQERQVALSRNPEELQRRVAQLQRMQANLVRVQGQAQAQMAKSAARGPKGPFKEFELVATEKAEVRMGFLPVRYDDKGNIKEFTKEELAKLRGKDNKPGIPATFEDLQPGQIVKVVLARGAASKDPAKSKQKDDVETVVRPQVTMIVILAESKDTTPATSATKKKNKK
ncbi:MAG: hypothetical protein FJ271_14860 [Planctomycetes bacterium]|nr:hypothetical protein [Planctomycetota bacterium]